MLLSPLIPWRQPQVSPILQYELGSMMNLVYLIVDWSSRQALWVDPQSDLAPPREDLRAFGLKLVGILLTHTHHDHIAGLAQLIAEEPLPVYAHAQELHRLEKHPARPHLKLLNDGESLSLGTLFIQALHTPGHSAGALSYLVDENLLTGDTLFIRDCGRTDLPTGSTLQMFETLQRYRLMNPSIRIFPGHHYQREYWSTLDQELRTSPPLQCKSVSELEALP